LFLIIFIAPPSSIKILNFQVQGQLNEPQEKVSVPKKVEIDLPESQFSL